jgi:hypothetical protein
MPELNTLRLTTLADDDDGPALVRSDCLFLVEGHGLQYAAALSYAYAQQSCTQCRSNLVSGFGLPKTGIFQISARDYRLFRSGTDQIRSLETNRQFTKARHWRAFLALARVKSPVVGLPGRRRGADRMVGRGGNTTKGGLAGTSPFPLPPACGF